MKEDKNEKSKLEALKKELSDPLFELTLKKPVEWEGKTYASFSFDFDSITCKDSLKVEREMTALGIPVMTQNGYSRDYLIRIAARCCNETNDAGVFEELGMRESEKIFMRLRYFLTVAE